MLEALIERVKAILAEDFGDGRLEGVSDDHPLLKNGLINSLEMVSVSAALEVGFGVKIPANAVTPENYATLTAIAALMARLSGQAGGDAIAEKDHPLTMSLLGALRRPVLWLLATVAFLVLSDLGLRGIIEGPLGDDWKSFTESGARLYPLSGRHSQESFEFASRKHRISSPRADAGLRVAFFGDSGTHGTWLPNDQALPQQTEALLQAKGIDTQVFNLAYFVTSIPKDLMVMGAVRKANKGSLPADMVVLALSDEYFSRRHQQEVSSAYQHLSANAALVKENTSFFPASSHEALDRVANEVRNNGKHLQPTWEWWLRGHAALFQYGPYIKIFLNRAVYGPIGRPRFKIEDELALGKKPLRETVLPYPPDKFQVLFNGLQQDDVHQDLITLYKGMLDAFRRDGVPVVIYLKPVVPKEWRLFFQPQPGAWTAAGALSNWCKPPSCRVADARWALDATQFTDSLAHYTRDGNLLIASEVANQLDALQRERVK